MIKYFKGRKFLLKFFSLLTSVFIWMYVVSSAELTTSKFIDLQIISPEGYSVSNVLNTKVEYTVKGPGLFVRKFIDQNQLMKIETKEYYKKNKSSYKVNLEKFQVKLPLGVKLLSMEPRYQDIKIESTLTKELPLEFNMPIDETSGVEIDFSPKKVQVSGPRSLIKKMNSFLVKNVPNFDKSKSFSTNIPLESSDSRIKIRETLVNYEYRIKPTTIEFTFMEIPIIFQSTKMLKKASKKVVTVLVRGDKSLIESIDQKTISILATVPNNSSKKYNIDLMAELPDGLELVKIIPSKISVTVE